MRGGVLRESAPALAVAAAAVVTVTFAAAPARAQEQGGDAAPPSTLRFDYGAPESCPSRALFIAQVKERAPGVRDEESAASEVVGSSRAATIVKVDVTEIAASDTGDHFAGALVITDATRGTSERSLSAASCADLVRALAFVVATYAVEADARAKEARSAPPTIASPVVADAGTAGADRPSEPPSGTAHAGVLVAGGARWDLVPSTAPAFAIGFERWDDRSPLAPAYRIQLGYARGSSSNGAGDTITAHLAEAAIDGCLFRGATRDRTFALQPCARFAAGAFVPSLAGGGAGATPWFELAAVLRARLQPAGDFFVVVDVALDVPLVAHRLYASSPSGAQPIALVAESPAAAPLVSFAAGWRFR